MFRSVWLWISGAVLGAFALIRYVFVRTVRIEKEFASILYDLIQSKGRSFVLLEEISTSDRLPREFSALCLVRGLLMKFIITERMLRAGWESTDSVATVTTLRWQVRRLVKILTEREEKKKEYIAINVLGTYGSYRLGKRKIPDPIQTPYIDPNLYEGLSGEVSDMIDEKIARTSALLYGPPGNGKSFLARYLALKYGLDIHLLVLIPEMSNQDLVRSFSHVKGPAMVLIEDFDAYFEGRTCKFEKANFSLDAILNILDGTYITLEQVVVMMTVNDIDKVDPALKHRPGRLRHVIEIPNPDAAVRARALADHPDQERLIRDLSGCNLDEVLAARDSDELARHAIRRARSGEDVVYEPMFVVKRKKSEEDTTESKPEET